MNRFPASSRRLAITALLFAIGGTSVAAPAERTDAAQVRWNEETWRFADIRATLGADEGHLKTIAEHIGRLAGRALPAGQRIEVEITDVDLAGEMRWLRHSAQEVRVIRGRADFPRIELKWALKEGDRTLRQGEERLVDLAYTSRVNRYGRDEPLRYEKRMLDEWFGQSVAALR